jgi:2-hydroxycyclohexanecarboxyl-CoA dehydrogenase
MMGALSHSRVTVDAGYPGFADTPLRTESVGKVSEKIGSGAAKTRVALARSNVHGRLIKPDQVAQTVLWLCPQAADLVNGLAIAVAGGPI